MTKINVYNMCIYLLLQCFHQAGETNDELTQLKERIAELEDEKGNLQLLLVDFDEIQGKNFEQNKIAHEVMKKINFHTTSVQSKCKADLAVFLPLTVSYTLH